MSDDLAKRLRLPSFSKRDRLAAADRIEELEGQLQSILDRETSILRYYDAKLDAADAKLTVAMVGLVQSRDKLDLYSQRGYSSHPAYDPYRQRDYDANPARIAIAKVKGEQP